MQSFLFICYYFVLVRALSTRNRKKVEPKNKTKKVESSENEVKVEYAHTKSEWERGWSQVADDWAAEARSVIKSSFRFSNQPTVVKATSEDIEAAQQAVEASRAIVDKIATAARAAEKQTEAKGTPGLEDAARPVQANSATLDRVATIWTTAVEAWEATVAVLEGAKERGWTAVAAKSLVIASKATADGSLAAEARGVAAAWKATAAAWDGAATELIQSAASKHLVSRSERQRDELHCINSRLTPNPSERDSQLQDHDGDSVSKKDYYASMLTSSEDHGLEDEEEDVSEAPVNVAKGDDEDHGLSKMQSPFEQGVSFVYAKDLDAAKAFYHTALQLPVALEQRDEHGELKAVFFAVTPTCFFGCVLVEPESMIGTSVVADGVMLTMSVPTTAVVDEWAKTLTVQGIALEKPPMLNVYHEIYHIFFRDPDGHLCEIQCNCPSSSSQCFLSPGFLNKTKQPGASLYCAEGKMLGKQSSAADMLMRMKINDEDEKLAKLFGQTSHGVNSIPAAVTGSVIGLLVGCGVTFAVLHFRHSASTAGDKPLLAASSR